MWSENGYVNQPHIGNVYIENDVEIFPYTNVVRGTLGTTKFLKDQKSSFLPHKSRM